MNVAVSERKVLASVGCVGPKPPTICSLQASPSPILEYRRVNPGKLEENPAPPAPLKPSPFLTRQWEEPHPCGCNCGTITRSCTWRGSLPKVINPELGLQISKEQREMEGKAGGNFSRGCYKGACRGAIGLWANAHRVPQPCLLTSQYPHL